MRDKRNNTKLQCNVGHNRHCFDVPIHNIITLFLSQFSCSSYNFPLSYIYIRLSVFSDEILSKWILSEIGHAISAVLAHGHAGQLPGAPRYSMYVVYNMFFNIFKHWFRWKYQYNKYMFNFIDNLHVYSVLRVVVKVVSSDPSVLLCPGPIMLLRRPCMRLVLIKIWNIREMFPVL